MSSATQNAAILARLQRGDTITPMDALNDPAIRSWRLGARIWDLRHTHNHDIETLSVSVGDKTVAGYRMRVRVEENGQRLLV